MQDSAITQDKTSNEHSNVLKRPSSLRVVHNARKLYNYMKKQENIMKNWENSKKCYTASRKVKISKRFNKN